MSAFRRTFSLCAATLVAALPALPAAGGQDAVFRVAVNLVQVAAVVTDGDGRFIKGLTRDDFIVYDNGKPREIETFTSERVPVSLGILLDVSSSMTDDQLATARSAIESFVNVLAPEDELFLMEFAGRGRMLQGWTRDRNLFRLALGRANEQPLRSSDLPQSNANGRTVNTGSAVFDAVATALGFAAKGVHSKKALLVISDGYDISSRLSAQEVQEAIRASEILVYALGVEGGLSMSRLGPTYASVNAAALRRLTDDTGGRTEVVRGFRNLAQATARLADELNQQYQIGYAAPSRDGRWHEIKVEVRKRGARIRARAGYVAS